MLDSLDDKIVFMDLGMFVDELLNISVGGIFVVVVVVIIVELFLISMVCWLWWWNVIEYMSLEIFVGRFLIEYWYV